ncbi:replication-relaxation family protein [Saccharothrix sp. NPDC042600]|uniref:replication-relaxation family protein n=1 Tax=Saccharothrix TaxID=2071 RepID=UPI0033E6010F|nr:hypothetical protein GCM10017745_35340 [Saccharothrix mutabilis subsp. capreolus]
MSHHRRLTGSRLALLSDRLTTRDRQVLRSLATMHAATTDQVARCVFPRAPSALRLARRHLHRLDTSGLVHRFADRSRDRLVGTPGHVYALTNAGLRLAGGHHALGHRQRHAWRPTPTFLVHRLAISELFARLSEQQASGGPIVREFLAEPDAWRSYLGPAGEQLVLRPDALVRLALPDGHENSWFIEVDRDTETRPATIAAKCRAYQRYEASGHEQRRHGVFPGVAFIVPSAARAAQVHAVIVRQPPEVQPLFHVMRDDQVLAALAELEPTF